MQEVILSWTKDLISDVYHLHKNLFSWDTVKIISVMTPIQIFTAAFLDEPIQNFFYSKSQHLSINQIPFSKTILRSVNWLRVGICLFGLLSTESRGSTQIFIIGTRSCSFLKKFIKRSLQRFLPKMMPLFSGKISSLCLIYQIGIPSLIVRPPNELFPNSASVVGIPSGHTIHSSFITFFYSFRYGWKVGAPLSILSIISGIVCISSNRHYPSQIICGNTIGLLYAVAANKIK